MRSPAHLPNETLKWRAVLKILLFARKAAAGKSSEVVRNPYSEEARERGGLRSFLSDSGAGTLNPKASFPL